MTTRNRRIVTYALAALAALFVESRLRVFGIAPNLTVIVAYYMGLRYGAHHGVLVGAGLGVLKDGAIGGIVGPSTLSMSTVGLLASHLRGGLLMWNPLLGMLALGFLTGLDGLLSYACLSIFQQPRAELAAAALALFWQAAANAPLGFIIRPDDSAASGGLK